MIIRKGLRYRVYPTNPQLGFVRQVAGCVRLVKNLAIEQRRLFGRRGRSFRYEGQRAELSSLKEAAPFLREVPHHCLQEALVDVQKGYDRFFAGQGGYPKPRGKYDTQSFRFPDPKQFRIMPSGDGAWAKLILPKMGKTKHDHGPLLIRLHRPIEGKVRSITMVLEGDHLYASILVEQVIADPVAPTGPAIGVDRGVTVPLMRSDGVMPYVPVPSRRQDERRRRLARNLSRCKRGSRNRSKARRALARHEAAVTRRRRDALHKATYNLARHHRRVAIEDLRVRAMTASARGTPEQPGRNVAQKAGLNRAILARGWGMMAGMLAYKCQWYGSELEHVPPPGTSQTCSRCGHRDPESRVTRDLFRCTRCGLEMHADLNAALNIRGPEEKGEREPRPIQAACFEERRPEDTCPGSACGDLCAPDHDRSGKGMSTKQEPSAARPGSLVLQGEV